MVEAAVEDVVGARAAQAGLDQAHRRVGGQEALEILVAATPAEVVHEHEFKAGLGGEPPGQVEADESASTENDSLHGYFAS